MSEGAGGAVPKLRATRQELKQGIKIPISGFVSIMVSTLAKRPDAAEPSAVLIGYAGAAGGAEVELAAPGGSPLVLVPVYAGAKSARLVVEPLPSRQGATGWPAEGITEAGGLVSLELPPDVGGEVLLSAVDRHGHEVAAVEVELVRPTEAPAGSHAIGLDQLEGDGLQLPVDEAGYGQGALLLFPHYSCRVRLEVEPQQAGGKPVHSWIGARVAAFHTQLHLPSGEPAPAGLRVRLAPIGEAR